MLGAYCLATMCFIIRHNLCKQIVRLFCRPPASVTYRLEDTTSVMDSPTHAKAYLHTQINLTYSISACAFTVLASLIYRMPLAATDEL